jgi:hypothetical protein
MIEEPKRRYCLCRNPQTAGREGTTRERLLERTCAELDKIASSRRWDSAKRLNRVDVGHRSYQADRDAEIERLPG